MTQKNLLRLLGFFSALSALYLYFFILIVLAFAVCPYCTTHTTQTSKSQVGFEPATPGSDRPQTFAVHHSATDTGTGVRTLTVQPFV
jgi:hypothetical protein